MRIFAAGIATETNTFSPIPTALEDFAVQRGRDAAAGKIDNPSLDLSASWGRQACERGYEFIFGLMAWAQPAGLTVRSAYEALREEMLRDLRSALPVDVVLLNLHGAMVAQGYDDCEEDLIGRVREIVGRKVIIGVELDLHCNLTKPKICAADLVITYKEYPHTDLPDRARELFELAVAARLGRIRPTMALFDCRMTGLYPTTRAPMRAFVEVMAAAEKRSGVLSVSFAHSFPYADLPHIGAKTLAITDNNPHVAEQLARELGLQVYGLRHEIGCESFSLPLEQALTRALASAKRPVVVADQSDNAGGGAPADATFVLRWLLEHRVTDVAMAIFYDPEVVRLALRAGVGAVLPFRLGGKLGLSSGAPVDLEAKVLSFLRNHFHPLLQRDAAPFLFPAGDVVALRCAGIDIVVSSERCQCMSPVIFSDLGIDPKAKRLLIPKSVQHFHAAFAPIAGEIIYMSAPGAVVPDPRQISYQRLQTGRLYPWTDDPLGD
jgi:microcystin degradation protein MlrC